MTIKEFAELLEYSSSLPTGKTIGKKWKKDATAFQKPEGHYSGREAERKLTGDTDWWDYMHGEWYQGEYVVDPDPKYVGINWTKIEVIRE